MPAFLLTAVFLAAAVNFSVSASDLSAAHQLSNRLRLNGQLFESQFFLLVDDLLDDCETSKSKRKVIERALGPVLPKPLIEIIVDFSDGCRPRLFAEALYRELYRGETDLLGSELYDGKRNILKNAHYFWVYLSSRVLPVVLGFVHMLWESWNRHPHAKQTINRFARLVPERVPQATYFVAHYFDSDTPCPLIRNTSVDAWPQALIDDKEYFESAGIHLSESVVRIHYLLVRSSVEQLRAFLDQNRLGALAWRYVFRALHAAEPALLHRFFALGCAKNAFVSRRLFEASASLAMGVDPTLSGLLHAVAQEHGWAEPVAKKAGIPAKFKDDERAGGAVHMQPLVPVSRSLDDRNFGIWYAVSLTGKTAGDRFTHLFVAADNVLSVLCFAEAVHIHIRSFEDGRVRTFALDAGQSVEKKVHHGDVVAVALGTECPTFLCGPIAGVSGEDCFEDVKAFCFFAKNNVKFLAIVEGDGLVREAKFGE